MIGNLALTFAGVVFLLAILAFFRTVHAGTWGFREGFVADDFITNQGYPTKQLCDAPLTTLIPILSGPGDATLDSPRDAYKLLDLPAGGGSLANMTSEQAYYLDGQKRIEKTGSYGQVTNNYRHLTPDNGSTPLHELGLSFYQTDFNRRV
jgi:hypothetical protein